MIFLFELTFADDWDKFYSKFDSSQKERIWKKIQKLKTLENQRHLKHGLPFFVVEEGQYRVCFEEKENVREIVFAGTHKQYEKWYKMPSL